MFKDEVTEAAPIVATTVDELLIWLPSRGETASDVRRLCGDIKAKIQTYLHNDTLGPPLSAAFQASREAGLTLPQMNRVRSVAAAQEASLIGAVVVRDACIQLALVEMSRIIGDMVFVSKTDVDYVRTLVQAGFQPIEEELCDQMDAMSFRTVIELHAAVIAYLTERARPLPQMLQFRFGHSWPTLAIAHKLYANAGRADELRNENKVVHPAFELPYGRALSK
jgi:prophage DNA circulation protein